MQEIEHKTLLERLRALDDGEKRKVFIGATVAIMALVVYVWLAYFNDIVMTASLPASEDGGGPVAQEGGVDRVKNGMADIFNAAGNALHGLGDILNAPRQYIIQPPR